MHPKSADAFQTYILFFRCCSFFLWSPDSSALSPTDWRPSARQTLAGQRSVGGGTDASQSALIKMEDLTGEACDANLIPLRGNAIEVKEELSRTALREPTLRAADLQLPGLCPPPPPTPPPDGARTDGAGSFRKPLGGPWATSASPSVRFVNLTRGCWVFQWVNA